MNDQEVSSLRLRLEEIYSLADKNLGQSKEDMIVNDIRDYSFEFVSNKIKAIKQVIISGQKFDTAMVYRYLGFKENKKQIKPNGCDKCDDGYILAIVDNREIGYACSCELGKFRNRTEKMQYYKQQELAECMKLKYGIIDVDSNIAKKYLQNKPIILEKLK